MDIHETFFVYVVTSSVSSSHLLSSIINSGSEVVSIEDVESLGLCEPPTCFETLEGDECDIAIDDAAHGDEILREIVGVEMHFSVSFAVSSSKILFDER